MSRWQGFDTEDGHVCEECGCAWETARQAEDCGADDRLADRFERTCTCHDIVHITVHAAEACERATQAEHFSDRT